MEKQTAIAMFESLSAGVRLDVFKLLVKNGPAGMVAGEIATALAVPATNLSFHLKSLTQARLVTVEHEGRYQRYRANLPMMLDLVAYLTAECCSGHPEQCADLRAGASCCDALSSPIAPDPVKPETLNVLFLCTGNSCRSILAEAIFNHLAPAGWKALSAGSRPAGTVHPRTLALLAREGISTHGLHSKSWDHLPLTPDIVVTVCSSAAGEPCPAYLGAVPRSHWDVADPAAATGTDEEIDAAFATAYRILRRRVEAMLALPLAALTSDPVRLTAES